MDRGTGEQSSNVEALALTTARDDARQMQLGRLYREHADFVWRIVLRLGIPESMAEDVAHEVFMVVGRRLPDYDERTPFRAWLYGIARGVAANQRRSTQRSERRLRAVPAPTDPPSPEDRLQRSQAAALVEHFLDTLRPQEREVFVLIDIEGLSGPEAAKALGRNLNSVYSRLRLARSRFRQFAADAASSQQQTV